MTALQPLAGTDSWEELVAIAVFGATGGLLHVLTTDERSASKWRGALVGLVAAFGFTAFRAPATNLELVGLPTLAGFFARSVLAALQSRIDLALAHQQADRALALANDAIETARRTRAPGAPAPEGDVGKLSARLDEVKAARSSGTS